MEKRTIKMDDIDTRSFKVNGAQSATYTLESSNGQIEWNNGLANAPLISISINGNTSYNLPASPLKPSPILGFSGALKLNDEVCADFSTVRLYRGETYDSTTGLVNKITKTITLTGNETTYLYEVNGLHGVEIHSVLDEQLYRDSGLCSHEDRVGAFNESSGSYMFLGYGTYDVYWVGVLDVLGISTVAQFKTWLQE